MPHLMSAAPAGDESKGPAWLHHLYCENLVRHHFFTRICMVALFFSALTQPIVSMSSPTDSASSPRSGPSKPLESHWISAVRPVEPDRRKKKGRSVLLWGYLPEDAGWVGVDFLYMTVCFLRGRRLSPHDSSSWKGTDTAILHCMHF